MRVIACLLLLLGGCESCEFTYGSYPVDGRLIVKGTRPADLAVRLCKTARPDDCIDVRLVEEPNGILSFDTGIPAEGFFTCDFDHRWLVITGSGCGMTSLELLPTSDINQPPPPIDEPLDVSVVCNEG